MSYHVELTPEAETDLRLIYRYIAEKKENPGAAFSLVDSIYEEIASLAEMPSRYPTTVIALRVFYDGRNV